MMGGGGGGGERMHTFLPLNILNRVVVVFTISVIFKGRLQIQNVCTMYIMYVYAYGI